MYEGDSLEEVGDLRRGGREGGFFSNSQEGNLHGRTATLPRLDVNPIEPPTPSACQPY